MWARWLQVTAYRRSTNRPTHKMDEENVAGTPFYVRFSFGVGATDFWQQRTSATPVCILHGTIWQSHAFGRDTNNAVLVYYVYYGCIMPSLAKWAICVDNEKSTISPRFRKQEKCLFLWSLSFLHELSLGANAEKKDIPRSCNQGNAYFCALHPSCWIFLIVQTYRTVHIGHNTSRFGYACVSAWIIPESILLDKEYVIKYCPFCRKIIQHQIITQD